MNAIKTLQLEAPFQLESGAHLQDLQIAYRCFGKLNKAKDNVIWVFHAISGDTNVLDWWSGLFGTTCLYSPEKYFIICANTIGSPYGSTAPKDLSFPFFSLRDVVNAHQALAKELDITKIHTAIGASFGGNQALEFAYSFAGTIEHLILIASSSRESAWGIAVHESQRIAQKTDPSFGLADGGEAGMKAARAVAMLTYRTANAFIEQQTDVEDKLDNFKAASYIQYQGDKFVKRFNALAYYYLTKCLDSHNIGRGRGGESKALSQIKIPTLVIGIQSDVLIPTNFQKFLAENIPNANYEEITSNFGHDGFLVESEKISKCIALFYHHNKYHTRHSRRIVLKFGGKSQATEKRLLGLIELAIKEATQHPIAIVVSARGSSTNHLIELYQLAKSGEDYSQKLFAFFEQQQEIPIAIKLQEEQVQLNAILQAIKTLGIDDQAAYDQVLAFGELIAAKTMAQLLQNQGQNALFVDARKLLYIAANGEVDLIKSKTATQAFFQSLTDQQIPVITGFIATNEKNKTVTLGRNGSNYSATLIASFINALEVQNWTDVDGVYSASPKHVPNAVRIETMSYREANELANFGVNVLHPKTILPLMQSSIPLRIKSSYHPNAAGTLINKQGASKGIKAVTVIEDVALISIEGRGLSGAIGIDGRIFSTLGKEQINIRLISQASSERGIGFVVNKKDAIKTELLLHQEFQEELRLRQISSIALKLDIAIIAIVGRHNYSLEKAIYGLRRNKIWLHLISNSISGEHISLVIDNRHLHKAVRVVHNQVFGVHKILHLFSFGKGNVGGALIDQILKTSKELTQHRNLEIKVIGVADAQKYIFDPKGLDANWRAKLAKSTQPSQVDHILQKLTEAGIENIVLADNTSSLSLAQRYPHFIKQGFDIVASNKKANSADYAFHANLRKELKKRARHFYYEANVGAGLPIIDTLKNLYNSSDKITKIKGVFSGSLSYIFNHFSQQESTLSFSDILAQAKKEGLTEADPREDLSGIDVARKLIILAREIGLPVELKNVELENLVPACLRTINTYADFWKNKAILDEHYAQLKSALAPNQVLRYIGELDVSRKQLKVALIKLDQHSRIGNIQQADTIFEIYTSAYAQHPIIVQGAGAGAEVTARGVYSDLLRIGLQL